MNCATAGDLGLGVVKENRGKWLEERNKRVREGHLHSLIIGCRPFPVPP
jgi:hypothetical protein